MVGRSPVEVQEDNVEEGEQIKKRREKEAKRWGVSREERK